MKTTEIVWRGKGSKKDKKKVLNVLKRTICKTGIVGFYAGITFCKDLNA